MYILATNSWSFALVIEAPEISSHHTSIIESSVCGTYMSPYSLYDKYSTCVYLVYVLILVYQCKYLGISS